MTEPTRYNVGDRVVITEDCIRRMMNSHHSSVTPGYPSESFIDNAKLYVGIEGQITHTFPPGYEVTAAFAPFPRMKARQSFLHMKDNWIEPA
jgi:hypothetical protein